MGGRSLRGWALSLQNDQESAYFVRSGGGAPREIFPGVLINAVAGKHMMLSVVNLAEGASVPLHEHPHEQMGLLVSGVLEFTIGGRTEVLSPGDIWRIPGGVPHSVVALGGPAVALDAFHPVREDYL